MTSDAPFRTPRRSLNKYQFRQLVEADWDPPDGGWGWACVFSCFLTFFLIVGMSRTFGGIIYNDVIEAFPGTKNVDVSIIPSMLLSLIMGLGVVAGALSLAFSVRKIAFIGGLLAGLGTSANYFAMSALYMQFSCFIAGVGAGLACNAGLMIAAKYFRKHRTQAVGLSVAGTGIGSVIQPYLLQFLVDKYGFRGALLIVGAILLHVSAGALLYRDPVPKKRFAKFNYKLINASHDENLADFREKIEKQYLMDAEKSNACFRWTERYLFFNLNLFYSLTFVITCVSGLLLTVGYPVSVIFIPPHAISLGYSKHEGGVLLSLTAAGDLIGRLLGFIFDKDIINKRTGYIISSGLMSISLIGFAVFENYIAMCFCTFFYGLGAGCAIILIPVLLSENHGASNLPSSLGIVRTLMGVSVFIGSTISGYIIDVTGEFVASMLTLGGVSFFSCVLICFIPSKPKNIRDQSQTSGIL